MRVIDAGAGAYIKAWEPEGLPFEEEAVKQLVNCARLPFIWKYVAAMPDCHAGWGSTVGSVLPVKDVVLRACVSVDIGCGMSANRLNIKRENIPDLPELRRLIENAVPHGRTNNGGPGDRGAWAHVPVDIRTVWDDHFQFKYDVIGKDHPKAISRNTVSHLGTLGTGNHFIELAEDAEGFVWIVLHSGSRGLGNRIGTYFSNLAKELCEKWYVKYEQDLAYIPVHDQAAQDYIFAVKFAQDFAFSNRMIMMTNTLNVVSKAIKSPDRLQVTQQVNCHHNYIAWERHFGQDIMVIRKGAVRAQLGDLGIIPGSMGARTYIVEGLGNRDSFCSCSHGAGRRMSRTKAEQVFTVQDHIDATQGVECDKSEGVLDETPGAYKSIESVMSAQADLVKPIHVLKQFLNVKGIGDKRRRK